ncbi:Aste57867_20701 [Aphanomyces stellatus]|uniref:Aste57867_20701 protein n=1 Tax=Aphanomyces stellatus TaxID=120398 RepID=A0A485LH17_9STRA|nr:hypothetical protein As57867_020633 [Aphanomyces stellatus]VFT97381.1 Aste57867_20701 [Aphanomyces stellatus]
MDSLLELCARAVAQAAPVDEILAYAAFLPKDVTRRIWRHMQPARLRELELLLVASAPDVALIDEIERQWEIWTEEDVTVHFDTNESSRYFARESDSVYIRSTSLPHPRPFRSLYWEHAFRAMLSSVVDAVDHPLSLFDNAVFKVKLRGKELTATNLTRVLAVQSVRRVEVHHIDPSDTAFWPRLTQLILHQPHLQELCILHSRLSTFAPISDALQGRHDCPIAMLEVVSVKLRPAAFLDLSRLVPSGVVRGVRLSNTIVDHEDTASLISSMLASLDTVLLPHNELDDDALATIMAHPPPSIRRLSLGHNCLTNVAALRHCTHLVDLDLSHNDLRDGGIHVLATACLPSLPRLTTLILSECAFSLVGAVELLAALTPSTTLHVLDIGHNYLGPDVAAVVAAFLAQNASVTALHLNYVNLGQEGVTDALCTALRQASRLTRLAVAENRLWDSGAAKLFAAMPFPMHAIDLSGNVISKSGLDAIAAYARQATHCEDDRSMKRRQGAASSSSSLVDELNLRNNIFAAADVREALVPLAAALPVVWSTEWRHKTYDDATC